MRLRILFAPFVLLATLLGGCIHPPFDMPDASIIRDNDGVAVSPDCRQLAVRSGLTDAGLKQPAVAWGCATYSNLAAQVANPRDLEQPAPVGPADAAVAANAMRRYEQDKVTPLDKQSSRDAK
ncbi:CpaD family pilus assembly lipoprotein [Paraburkholderia lycopersici]|nr:CpaD family pilus assembly lipoprotein [Paraburkholderia lycopersici]